MRNNRRRRDQDSPWKTLITLFFPQLIQLIHPELYALIDWQRGYQFLDSELRKIAPRSRTGRQTVDKLVQVYLRDGSEYWILIHIEAQSHPDPDFEARMFTYYATLWVLYRRPIVSIAILADNDPNWRPSAFTQSLGGCRVEFNFYTVKLLDMDEEQLLNDPNPCALILAAFRRAMRADTAEFMLASRMELVRLALDRGYTEEQVENLIRLLEWVMVLPEVLEERYEQFLEEVKREQNTPYLSVLERKALREGWEQGVQKGLQEGHEKGLQEGRAQGLQEGRAQGLQEGRAQGLQEGRAQGLQEGILTLLRTLYGAVPAELEAQLRAIRDVATLNALYPLAVSAGSLESFAQQLAQRRND
jgi:hypothetical protein